MRHIIVLLSILWPVIAATGASHASDFKIFNQEPVEETRPALTDGAHEDGTLQTPRFLYRFSVRWDNAWNNDVNHDSAWIFAKVWGRRADADIQSATRSVHGRVIGTPKVVDNLVKGGPDARFIVADDKGGFFVHTADKYQGPVGWTIEVEYDFASLAEFRRFNRFAEIHGVEMVHIPEGSFKAGLVSELDMRFAGFYQSDHNGAFKGPYPIHSESQTIEVNPNDGALYYQVANAAARRGDQTGVIPAAFPKGYNAFTIMKYELNEGQYAAFLNDLEPIARALHSGFLDPGYADAFGGLEIKNDKVTSATPTRSANFIRWSDGLAWLDWAALRPVTELEYEKAARGTDEPIARAFPWGTASKAKLMWGPAENRQWGMLDGGAGPEALTHANLERYGVSPYWVFDLAGGLWERTVTIGDADGRAFAGSHGDGLLDTNGFATNSDWPTRVSVDGDGTGFGYRGGANYGGRRLYNEFNPHSPVSYRTFGSWSGNGLHRAYGFRGGRSAGQ